MASSASVDEAEWTTGDERARSREIDLDLSDGMVAAVWYVGFLGGWCGVDLWGEGFGREGNAATWWSEVVGV
jgi:hypothetical protein